PKKNKTMACPNSCGPITLLPTPTDCLKQVRLARISRFAYWDRCMEWPDPITDQNIDALILNGDIVLTNEVSDLAFEEPTFDEVPIGGCTPDRQVVVSRTITGNDRIIASNLEGSPAVEVPY